METGLLPKIYTGSTGFEKICIDNPVAFSTVIFDNILTTATKMTAYVPEEGAASYAATYPWNEFPGGIKYRRKVIFHPNDNSPNNRVSFTYPDQDGDEKLYYWYSNVNELMETPELDSAAVKATWYKDVELTQPWNFATDTVRGSESLETPTPIHLYAAYSTKTYYNVRLFWNDPSKETCTDTEAEAGVPVASVVPTGLSRTGYFFRGWYTTATFTGDPFERGNPPTYDELSSEPNLDGVIPLSSDLTLYAKWESKPWITQPLLIEIPEGGTFQDAFAAAYALRSEHTELPETEIYAYAKVEVRGTINYDAIYNPGGMPRWYTNTLRDKVVALDLREAHTTIGESQFAHYNSILQEIRLPVDGALTSLGSPFGHVAPSIRSLYLPASVTRIDGPEDNPCLSPFAFTYGLKNMYIDAVAPPAVSAYVWHQAGNFTLHVPEGSKVAYEADQWSNGTCKWTYRSPDDGGISANTTIVERPRVTFHTAGGTRPLYAYTSETADTYYWYVNAGDPAYETVPTTDKAGHVFDGWYTDSEFTTPYAGETVTLGQGGLDLYAKWTIVTGIDTFAPAADPVVTTSFYTLQGVEIPEAAASGMYIRKEVYASGKVSVRKEIKN
jgi:uncharacterized repeat protein (TIGR02543 family)